MESIQVDYEYDEDDDTEVFNCPFCEHQIENTGESVFDPCEHVVACYISDASEWEVATDDIRDKHEKDIEFADNADEYPEIDPSDIEEWGMKNIEADMCVSLTGYGMACGPCSSTSYYFFKKLV